MKSLDDQINIIVKAKDIYENYKNEADIDKKYFPQNEEFKKIRNDNGVNTFMAFINNFFNTTKAENILTVLYKKLNPSNNKASRLLRGGKISNTQYSYMRIWSSYRFEEALEKSIELKKKQYS